MRNFCVSWSLEICNKERQEYYCGMDRFRKKKNFHKVTLSIYDVSPKIFQLICWFQTYLVDFKTLKGYNKTLRSVKIVSVCTSWSGKPVVTY